MGKGRFSICLCLAISLKEGGHTPTRQTVIFHRPLPGCLAESARKKNTSCWCYTPIALLCVCLWYVSLVVCFFVGACCLQARVVPAFGLESCRHSDGVTLPRPTSKRVDYPLPTSSTQLTGLACGTRAVALRCVVVALLLNVPPLQVNFTIEPSTCLRDAGFVSRLLVSTVVGYDEIMVNMFMFSMRSKGLLKNTQVWLRTEESTATAPAVPAPAPKRIPSVCRFD